MKKSPRSPSKWGAAAMEEMLGRTLANADLVKRLLERQPSLKKTTAAKRPKRRAKK